MRTVNVYYYIIMCVCVYVYVCVCVCVCACVCVYVCVCYGYTMDTSGLPDIYTRSLRAAGRGLRLYISGKPRVDMV